MPMQYRYAMLVLSYTQSELGLISSTFASPLILPKSLRQILHTRQDRSIGARFAHGMNVGGFYSST